ncbi:uncharacterized protein LOC131016232 isoform X2 [Salvia miltiorrhiza]|uniref:uncharacterized protein LOC131016232 isoform X2 n=1 Tax=Salvia miltiorrhiza TaxID=226208 RepID=UPI0025AB83FD|nr:uncharacterized protein LOC131016232 isoform X2 [Salvia miltiorrhiza]XP_057800862.1 uncharacterized protein LOC131016232 isoform X2 [Salvia miltiorrhiza]XP_057800863.1 uncharacterized protein LOC131016232 isoform X2 [Salvia miltiorrhiza]
MHELQSCRTSSRRTYGLLFDWIYPAYMPVLLRGISHWADTPECIEKLLDISAATLEKSDDVIGIETANECIKFLKDVQIGDQDISPSHFQPSDSLLNIYLEACPTILKVGVLSSNHVSEEIEKLDVSHMRANSKMRSAGGSDAAADDIETEANSYFHQMFSGHLSMDAMIQMLTRFKESSDKRGCYFQEGTKIKMKMSVKEAFERSMRTLSESLLQNDTYSKVARICNIFF